MDRLGHLRPVLGEEVGDASEAEDTGGKGTLDERVGVDRLGRLRPVLGKDIGGRGGDASGRLEVGGQLSLVRPPHPFVVISHGWPGCLATIIALKLPIAAGIFPLRWHRYFKLPLSDGASQPWETLDVLRRTQVDWSGDFTFIVSGPYDFLDRTIGHIGGGERVIACCESDFRLGRRPRGAMWKRCAKVLTKHELRSVTLRDALCGGVTDCKHLFGFGKKVLEGGTRVPGVMDHVERCLRHYVDGGVRGRFELVQNGDLEPMLPAREAVRDPRGFFREEGLLPSMCPDCRVACPSFRVKGARVLRPLTAQEIFRVYQLPLSMDEAMDNGLQSPWPFEQAANPGVFSTIFHQLWGVTVGGGLTTAG